MLFRSEARLARVLVKVTRSTEDAERDRTALIEDASARGYKRIAELAKPEPAPAAAPATGPATGPAVDPMPVEAPAQ